MLRIVQGFLGKFFQPGGAGSLKDKIRRVMAVYRALDKEAVRFKVSCGLACPDQCGECCFSSNVEATELEMLPLAWDLVRLGKADEWYDRAREMNFEGRCVFYSSDNSRGCCRSYVFRPLVCRLFGYAGSKDKHEHLRLVTCKVLKKVWPQEVEQVLDKVGKGRLHPPLMMDFVMRVAGIDPDMTRDSLPVNQAFKKAVERVYVYQKFNTMRRG
ncbi:MAG: YkgJ family cysteine cluster protein [Candidatus Omnitrophica bacterium]|nr:YkgJ family cysteine cluster protein [Candidatus Omnitrophota bacterium]